MRRFRKYDSYVFPEQRKFSLILMLAVCVNIKGLQKHVHALINDKTFQFSDLGSPDNFNIHVFKPKNLGEMKGELNASIKVVEANGGDLLGVSANELVGRDLNTLLPVAIREAHVGWVAKYIVLVMYMLHSKMVTVEQLRNYKIFKSPDRVVKLPCMTGKKKIPLLLDLQILEICTSLLECDSSIDEKPERMMLCQAEMVDATLMQEQKSKLQDTLHQARIKVNDLHLVKRDIESAKVRLYRPDDELDRDALGRELDSALARVKGLLNEFPEVLSASNKAAKLKKNIKRTRIHLSEVIGALCESLQQGLTVSASKSGDLNEAARLKRITSTWKSGNWDGHILVDINYFKDVLGNLIGNAIKYAKSTVTIVVKKKLEKCSRLQLSIKVVDDGVGLTSEELPKVFGNCYDDGETVHSGNEQKAGAHIGLSFTKTKVDDRKDSLEVGSGGKGEGTCFTFTTTCYKTATQEERFDILFHEDNEPCQNVFGNMMDKNNKRCKDPNAPNKYSVIYFSNPEDALEYIKFSPNGFRMLLSDNEFCGSSYNGCSFIKEVFNFFKKNPGLRSTPLVYALLTGEDKILEKATNIIEHLSQGIRGMVGLDDEISVELFLQIIGVSHADAMLRVFAKPYRFAAIKEFIVKYKPSDERHEIKGRDIVSDQPRLVPKKSLRRLALDCLKSGELQGKDSPASFASWPDDTVVSEYSTVGSRDDMPKSLIPGVRLEANSPPTPHPTPRETDVQTSGLIGGGGKERYAAITQAGLQAGMFQQKQQQPDFDATNGDPASASSNHSVSPVQPVTTSGCTCSLM